ncbi:MAG: hypothetical protein O7F12_03980 [Nitrospirae bacterium]|nr:hypothetical protein [Nitrospirota bacterium]
MPAYAQTYLQLHHQIRRMGNSEGELDYLRGTYEFAMQVFSGYFQANGKSYLSHVVGTASILASLDVQVNIVAVGLLHNVYGNGDFGDGQSGLTSTHQKTIIQVVGEEVEAYLAAFKTMRWGPQVFPAIRDHLGEYDSVRRTVVLVHLADYLEHHLSGGLLYYSDRQRHWFYDCHDVFVEMYTNFGFPTLAEAFQQVHQENTALKIPKEFQQPETVMRGKYLCPKSCRRRYGLGLKEWRIHWFQRQYQATIYLTGEMRTMLKTVRNRFMPI